MKNIIWVALVLILAALFVLEFRYELVINSPIVAKIDRITGDVWIANSGVWLKLQHTVKERGAAQNIAAQKPAEKAAQGKANIAAQKPAKEAQSKAK